MSPSPPPQDPEQPFEHLVASAQAILNPHPFTQYNGWEGGRGVEEWKPEVRGGGAAAGGAVSLAGRAAGLSDRGWGACVSLGSVSGS